MPKKNMQILRDLNGPDTDSNDLLAAALSCGIKRVVIKRPRFAEYIAGQTPHHSIESPKTRFDIYLDL